MEQDKQESIITKMKKRAAKAAVNVLLPMIDGNLQEVDKTVFELLDQIQLSDSETHRVVLMIPNKEGKIICSTAAIRFQKENFRIVGSMDMEELIKSIIKMIPERM